MDEIDQRSRSGWSVLVPGLAEEITPAHRAELVARTEGTGLTSWAPGEYGALGAAHPAQDQRPAHRPRPAAAPFEAAAHL